MIRKLKYIILIAALCLTNVANADMIQGRVLDAETREPLDGAHVEVSEEIPDFCTMSTVAYTDSLGYFSYRCSGGTNLVFSVKFLGYEARVFRMRGTDVGDTIRIDDILLQPSEVLLNEVLVSGSQRRFYMRGDTVVFNPGAFQMDDGDRLLDLVLKLPGVSVRDDRLLWNGEPLKIRMNGLEALSEELLLKRLPVEAVADVKAYERKSELEKRTGIADGTQEHVLDVTIKPGFMDNWYGSVEATGYTSENYGTELDGMRLSDSDPVMLFGHVGDEPKRVVTHTMGSSGGESGGTAVRQQMGAAGYKHAWRPAFKVENSSYMTLTAGANHADSPQSSWQNTRTFLPGTTPTQTNSKLYSYGHRFKAPLDFSSFINLSPKNTLFLTAHAEYEKGETSNRSEQQTFESLTLNPVNSSLLQTLSSSRMFTGTIDGELTHYTAKGSVTLSASLHYSDTDDHGNSVGEYRYHQTATETVDKQSYEAPNSQLSISGSLSLSHGFTKQAMFHAHWHTTYAHTFRNERRYRAGMTDWDNSFRRADDLWLNGLNTDMNLTFQKITLKPALVLTHRHEQTDYRRAALDTLARRDLMLVRPSLELTWRIRKGMSLIGNLSYDETPADLLDCIAYTDDTNPLLVYQGNPSLTTSHTLNANLRYNFMQTRGSQVLGVKVNYARVYDPIGVVLHYNSQTGAYRSQKQNVRGGSSWGASLNYERSLAKNLLLESSVSEQWNVSYGILTMIDEQTGICYNRQNLSNLMARLGLVYDCNKLSVSSYHDFNWNRYDYSDDAQNTDNIFRYSTELRLRYDVSRWTFTVVPCFYLNRGYVSDRMNNNLLVLNAEVSCKFLKNRAELTLAARDILNKETEYASSITATTHTESGRSFLHHYATLTFRYVFDTRKK